MPVLKRSGCRGCRGKRVLRSPLCRAAPPARPLRAMGDCQPAPLPREPCPGMAVPGRDGGSSPIPGTPRPDARTELSGQTHGRQREGTACAESKASTGTNLCHTSPLPVRDLSATASLPFLAAVRLSFLPWPGQRWLRPHRAREAEPALQRSSPCSTPALPPGAVAGAHGASGTGLAELRQGS